jgi:hypothetical protein
MSRRRGIAVLLAGALALATALMAVTGAALATSPDTHCYTYSCPTLPPPPPPTATPTCWTPDAVNPDVFQTFKLPTFNICPTATPTATPTESFQGETATPEATATPEESPSATPCLILELAQPGLAEDFTPCPSPTPFESFQGETSQPTLTPPPTTSAGSQGSNDGSTPLLVLLAGLAFGGLGFMTLRAQKRSLRP